MGKDKNIDIRNDNYYFKTIGVKALVVEDNSVNRMIASNLIRQYGIEVDEINLGTLALQMYYNNKYDII